MNWDIFCQVIDNHGDAGVCWRLASQLASRGQAVRLWIDDASALSWMAPQGQAGVTVLPWRGDAVAAVVPGDVVIESFGCEVPDSFKQSMASRPTPPRWINLEYLTAERFAVGSHGLPSPVLAGPAAGLTKHFFYPGFTPDTGGLLREPGLLQAQSAFDREGWLRRHGIVRPTGASLTSLFCYEPPALRDLLAGLAQDARPQHLLVTAGRASASVREAVLALDAATPRWNAGGMLSMSFLPLLTQDDFDHLLWACDLNFVRGEDSLVRALWAGKPFVWHIYPQHDDAHHVKLHAFLDWLAAPASLRDFHLAWNGIGGGLPPFEEAAWSECAADARSRLLAQDDLATRLLGFVHVPMDRA